jgi:hypothetical protein
MFGDDGDTVGSNRCAAKLVGVDIVGAKDSQKVGNGVGKEGKKGDAQVVVSAALQQPPLTSAHQIHVIPRIAAI